MASICRVLASIRRPLGLPLLPGQAGGTDPERDGPPASAWEPFPPRARRRIGPHAASRVAAEAAAEILAVIPRRQPHAGDRVELHRTALHQWTALHRPASPAAP